jgi:AraC-like DNA-binding protein
MEERVPDRDLLTRAWRFADARDAPETPFETGIAGFTLVRCRTPTPLEGMIYSPLLCLVLQGRKESFLGPERVVFGPGESLIVSLDLPSQSRVTEASPAKPYVALALTLDLDLVRELIGEFGEAELADGRARAIAAGEADAALVEAMRRVFDLVERPLEQRVLLPLVRREIHFRLLLARHGGMLRRLARRDSHASRIARALARLRRDFTTPLRVAELAEVAGMSPSSFHEHFKAITATTPLQYQKDLRLLEARRRLASGGISVSGAAFAVGYESPTQFSREYARRFGTPPSAERAAAL